ncbi:hypothetical protein [Thermogutta sp.]|uniref:hypothetical protein n=1 Tax=Thermogutta sp. TaxID=1962930 RepID=UPI00321FDC08
MMRLRMVSALRHVWQALAELIVSIYMLHFLVVVVSEGLERVVNREVSKSSEMLLTLGSSEAVLVFPLWAIVNVLFLGSLRGVLMGSCWFLFDQVTTLGISNRVFGGFDVSEQVWEYSLSEQGVVVGLSILGVTVGVVVGFFVHKRVEGGLASAHRVWRLCERLVVPVAFVLGLGYVLLWEVDVAGTMTEVFGIAVFYGNEDVINSFAQGGSIARNLRDFITAGFTALGGGLARTVFYGDPGLVLGGLSFLVYCLAFRSILQERRPQGRFAMLPLAAVLAFGLWAHTGEVLRPGILFTECGNFKVKDRASASSCMVALWRKRDPGLLAVFSEARTWRLLYLATLAGAGVLVLFSAQILWPPRRDQGGPGPGQREEEAVDSA